MAAQFQAAARNVLQPPAAQISLFWLNRLYSTAPVEVEDVTHKAAGTFFHAVGDGLFQCQIAAFIQREVRIMGNLPAVTIRVREIGVVSAPEHLLRRFDDFDSLAS